ncbi:MAG: DUF169 domain-containing protein [Negativicutes bacterium]|nr:DUF169 domain-containing protein [Negativicutes bacterium]
MSYETVAQELERYIRPDTFPLAIRVLKPGEPVPAKAKRPERDLGTRLSVCQAVGMARRYGWTLAVGAADQSCPIAQTVFGYAPLIPYYEQGNLAAGMYCETLEAGAKAEAAIPKLGPGEAGTILVGPLRRADFEPEVVVVYANSAQVMRLAAGALFAKGGTLPATASPRADCADMIIGTRRDGEAKVILPCYGDRVFGLTQDHEMCFSIPFHRLDELLRGLEGTERGGVRYPIPVNLKVEAEFPPKYQQLAAMWKETGSKP